ncbi:unnamed protein product [Pedinophyceae sp. YPF-701]|nr:unnamed protein product [Pedinophyceae sp. YPF-701]
MGPEDSVRQPGRAEVEAILAWVRDHGGDVSKVEISAAAERTLVAQQRIAPGECSLTVPQHLILHAGLAQDDVDYGPDFRALAREEGASLDARFLLSLLLLVERCRGAESFWAPYVAVLPRTYEDPWWWDDDTLELISGTRLGRAVVAQGENVKTVGRLAARLVQLRSERTGDGGGCIAEATITGERGWGLTELAAKWARSSVWSRAFNVHELGDHGKTICLVPVIDMLDHNPGHQAAWHTAGGKGPFHMVTSTGVEAGATLWNNYGLKANEELLLGYGFALENNPRDFVHVTIATAPPPEDDAGGSTPAEADVGDWAQQAILLSAMGLENRVHLTRERPFPEYLINLTRVFLSDDAGRQRLLSSLPRFGAAAHAQSDDTGAAAAELRSPLLRCGAKTEWDVLRGLQVQLRATRDAMRGGADGAADLERARQAMAEGRAATAFALMYRAGQKDVCNAALEALHARAVDLAVLLTRLPRGELPGRARGEGAGPAAPKLEVVGWEECGRVLVGTEEGGGPREWTVDGGEAYPALRATCRPTGTTEWCGWRSGVRVCTPCQAGEVLCRLPLHECLVAVDEATLAVALTVFALGLMYDKTGGGDAAPSPPLAVRQLARHVPAGFAHRVHMGGADWSVLGSVLQNEAGEGEERLASFVAMAIDASHRNTAECFEDVHAELTAAIENAPGLEFEEIAFEDLAGAFAWALHAAQNCAMSIEDAVGVPVGAMVGVAILPYVCLIPEGIRNLIGEVCYVEQGTAWVEFRTRVALPATAQEPLRLDMAALHFGSRAEARLLALGPESIPPARAAVLEASPELGCVFAEHAVFVVPAEDSDDAAARHHALAAAGLAGCHLLPAAASCGDRGLAAHPGAERGVLAGLLLSLGPWEAVERAGVADLQRAVRGAEERRRACRHVTTTMQEEIERMDSEASAGLTEAAGRLAERLVAEKDGRKLARKMLRDELKAARARLVAPDLALQGAPEGSLAAEGVYVWLDAVRGEVEEHVAALSRGGKKRKRADSDTPGGS